MEYKTIENIRKSSEEIFSEVVFWRRHLHQNPELSFQEKKTAEFIEQILKDNGIETDISIATNSVIGIIKVNNKNNFIALRADIDAIAVQEENNYVYKSNNQGIMHACGHDAHTAALLGVAKILVKNKELLKNNILLIFQAAEEKNPGGAKILLDNGLLKKYNIKKIISQHVDPDIDTSSFAFGEGNLMASSDELYLTFSGKGGHAAMPEKRSDTVLAAVNFIKKIELAQKKYNALFPTIISFGKFIANGTVNVVPNETILEGTLRTYDENFRCLIKKELQKEAKKYAEIYRCSVNFEIKEGYPCLFNDSNLFLEIKNLAKNFLAEDKIAEGKIIEFKPRMGAEDFAFYSKKIPALLYRSGIRANGFGKNVLHSPNFDIDENFFIEAVGLMCYFAIKLV